MTLAAPPGAAATASGGDTAKEQGAGFGDGCDIDGAVHLLGGVGCSTISKIIVLVSSCRDPIECASTQGIRGIIQARKLKNRHVSCRRR